MSNEQQLSKGAKVDVSRRGYEAVNQMIVLRDNDDWLIADLYTSNYKLFKKDRTTQNYTLLWTWPKAKTTKLHRKLKPTEVFELGWIIYNNI